MKIKTLLIILLFLIDIQSYAASFDCSQAQTWIEQNICDDSELSQLDEDLAEAYKNALVRFKDANQLKSQQRDWIKQRNTCRDLDCVKQAYQFRLNFLKYGSDKNKSSNNTAFPYSKWLGEYSRKVKGHPATLELIPQGDLLYFRLNSMYEVNLAAGNIRTGEIEGKIEPVDNYAIFSMNNEDPPCKLYFELKINKIDIKESQCQNQGGLGVYFSGTFQKK